MQVGIRSITKEGREQGKRFGVEQYEMRTFSRDRQLLENLVFLSHSHAHAHTLLCFSVFCSLHVIELGLINLEHVGSIKD